MKKARIPLFTKFAIGISLTVLVFGLFNALIVRNSVSHALNTEFEKRGYFIARAVAEQAVFYILSEDPAGLNSLINEIKAIDPTIDYVFIVSEMGEVLAHSFPEQVPEGLLEANIPDSALSIVSVRDQEDSHRFIRDFSVPILSRNVAYVRLGILENEIVDHVNETITTLWFMVALFLLLGLLAALFFSYTIATPLRVLSNQSQNIDIRTIQDGVRIIREATSSLSFRIRRIFKSDDEIDMLYNNFSEMLQRLEQTHNAMNQLQQSLLQTEKMASIGTLTAGIAHEVNNPLAGLRIGLNRISRRPEDAEQTVKYIGMMQESLNKMEHVIQDLLTFSRRSPHEFEEVNTCEILRKIIKLASYRIRRNQIAIDIDPSNCPHKISIAANRMEQVFLNIIINAIDSVVERQKTEPGLKGKIQISIIPETDVTRIRFSDNGTGIENSLISKIFDPFYTTKKVGEGTGLGLSVSYQIVKDHGGDILVESEYGDGAVFTVVLPNHKREEKES
ncbi:MAG: ATP-binding protein [Bacteroides sp.]|jgi:two-component system NtrC family sensor kinase|nr:ATP-binding protein [Bacteroides sp.]